MHLVFLNQYYPPDAAPTGVMLEGLAQGLVRDGHVVTVLCALGGYAGTGGRPEGRIKAASQYENAGEAGRETGKTPTLRIMRIRATQRGRGTVIGKLCDYVSYYAGVAWYLLTLRPRPDRIIALTTPPYLSVLARLISKIRGADHAHWVMDLYPDVMVSHGMLREGSWIFRILAGLTRWGFGGRRCAVVLTLGPDMEERVERYVPEARRDRVKWVPLWAGGGDVCTEEGGGALRTLRGWGDGELVVMYSGNMGLGHRFGEMLEAARELAREPVRFVFFGGGKRSGEVEKFARDNPECGIEVHGYAPAEGLVEHLRSADVHLASLDTEWSGTMVPSKLQGIFAAGRPVIFIGSERSSIGRWVLESGGGWVLPPGDVSGLISALAEARIPGIRAARGRAAREFAGKHFDRQANIAMVAEVLAAPGDRI